MLREKGIHRLGAQKTQEGKDEWTFPALGGLQYGVEETGQFCVGAEFLSEALDSRAMFYLCEIAHCISPG